MLRLRVKAPFAACRTFTAGRYRPTAPFLTPSAAYGLLLNVAAIETRRDDGTSPMTVTAQGLPAVELALGAVRTPRVQTIFQQLHNYPVSQSPENKARAQDARGNKYNIQPIRRELLSDVDAYVCVRENDWLEERVRRGLSEGSRFAPEGKPRYGVPFLGDNSFTLSVLREEPEARDAAYWYSLVGAADAVGASNLCRLTVWIDRQDMSKTLGPLFRRGETRETEPPASAWVAIEPPA
jgi:CRISPR-associated protein Cas5t